MSKNRYYTPNNLHICIDDTSVKGICGRAYTKLQEEPILFTSTAEFLLRADELFDRVGFPQAFQEKRSFQEKEILVNNHRLQPELFHTDEKIQNQSGKRETLDLMVMSRMRSSWQGAVYSKNGEKADVFDGELQLIRIFEKS